MITRLPPTKPAPKLKLLRRLLSQPWIGPSISLIVLFVSVSSLAIAIASFTYNKSSFDRQTQRWKAEEESQFQLQLHIQPDLTPEGYRPAWIELYFPPSAPVHLDMLEIVAPTGAEIKAADQTIVKLGSETSASFEISQAFGPTSTDGPRIVVNALIRTPETPKDQNTVVRIRATAVERSGLKQTIERETVATIPSDAKRPR